MSTSAVTPYGNTTQTAAPTSATNSLGGGMDGMFMQLLITQLQNQDPTNPTDPTTFVTQLVGVNSLDQLTQINQLLQSTIGTSSTTSTTSTGGH